jgi:hypothetical protein
MQWHGISIGGGRRIEGSISEEMAAGEKKKMKWRHHIVSENNGEGESEK